ncbi:MAG: hypothetical protein II852_07325 [Bacteroidales bacterium]|nr:hypothetical protein [Bacteroidales bacterium]
MIRKALTIKLLLTSSLSCGSQEFFNREVPQDMRTIFFCIVSSAENSRSQTSPASSPNKK